MVPKTNIPNPEQLEWMNIHLKVGKRVVEGDLAEGLAVPEDPEDLLKALARNPSEYFYWSTAAEVGRGEMEKAKRRYEMWYAKKYMEARKALMEEVGKSYITDTMIKGYIFENYPEEYEEYQDAILEAEYKKGTLDKASKAYYERGNALINILSWRKKDREEQGRA